MRRIFQALVFACFGALCACAGHHGATSAPTPAGTLPPLLIDDRGITMPLDRVVRHISYRPWIPREQILKFAVIPPLGNLDTPANRGVAIEYQSGSRALLLSEWPKQNFVLLFMHTQDITNTPCQVVHYKDDGVAWTTRSNLAMTLQPDGTMSPTDVENEARRLITTGACR